LVIILYHMKDKCNYYNTKSLNNILQQNTFRADILARGTKRVKPLSFYNVVQKTTKLHKVKKYIGHISVNKLSI
jgi:hypothetical protein